MKYKIRCTFLVVWLLYLCGTVAFAQQGAVKSNLLNDLTGTVSLGLEYSFSPRYSIDLSGTYKAWDFSEQRTWRMLSVQPELRYWFCERLNGAFVGVHAHWAKFNVGHLKMPWGLWKELRENRFEGDLAGMGVSYGYHWLLNRHWNLEAVIGLGYARVWFDKYPCAECGSKLESGRKHYWGPTKMALSLVYLF